MKISDIKRVNALIQIREHCLSALKQVDAALVNISNSPNDSPHVDHHPDYSIGYYCHISKFHDGNGNEVDLRGCYLAKEVYETIHQLLEQRLTKIENNLIELGVEPDPEPWAINVLNTNNPTSFTNIGRALLPHNPSEFEVFNIIKTALKTDLENIRFHNDNVNVIKVDDNTITISYSPSNLLCKLVKEN